VNNIVNENKREKCACDHGGEIKMCEDVSPVQFLREIGTHGEKQGVINDNKKEYWFG